MDNETTGTVVAVKKQWWLKINTKPIRMHALDGAIFPHIIQAEYAVAGQSYTKRKWIGAGKPVPHVGDRVTVLYSGENPKKAKIL
jgi:hypothetical protein